MWIRNLIHCAFLLVICAYIAVGQDENSNFTTFAKPDYTIYHTMYANHHIFTHTHTSTTLNSRLTTATITPHSKTNPYHANHNDLCRKDLFTEIHATVRQCKHFMHTEKHRLTSSGYSTTMQIVTVDPSGPSHDYNGKIRILINFGEHGRELISSEIALTLVDSLCNPASRNDILQRYGMTPETIEAVLHHSVIKIVPMENIRGRELVEGGMLCERKNGRGVDPNRNWEVHWGHKEPDYDPAEEFPGMAPFSEPEAAMLKAVAEEFRPHIWINVHSGMEALFVPYDHKSEIPKGRHMDSTLEILQKINKTICQGSCSVGPGGKSVGYLAHGTATDHMYDKIGVRIAMTWEVYGDHSASFDDCFKMFNPLDTGGYDTVTTKWTAAVFALLDMLPGHPSVPGLAHLVEMYKSGNAAVEGESDVGVEGGASEFLKSDAEIQKLSVTSSDPLSGYDWQRGRHLSHYALLGFACAVFAAFVTIGRSRQAFSRFRGRFRRRVASGDVPV